MICITCGSHFDAPALCDECWQDPEIIKLLDERDRLVAELAKVTAERDALIAHCIRETADERGWQYLEFWARTRYDRDELTGHVPITNYCRRRADAVVALRRAAVLDPAPQDKP